MIALQYWIFSHAISWKNQVICLMKFPIVQIMVIISLWFHLTCSSVLCISYKYQSISFNKIHLQLFFFFHFHKQYHDFHSETQNVFFFFCDTTATDGHFLDPINSLGLAKRSYGFIFLSSFLSFYEDKLPLVNYQISLRYSSYRKGRIHA